MGGQGGGHVGPLRKSSGRLFRTDPRDRGTLSMSRASIDAELLSMVEAAISQLAPAVRAACDLEYICDALVSLGCLRLTDLELFIRGDILIAQAALAPTPIIFLLTLKRLALEALAPPAAAATAGTASPAPGAAAAFQTPMGAGWTSTLVEPCKGRAQPPLGRFSPNFGMLPDLCGAHVDAHAKTRLTSRY